VRCSGRYAVSSELSAQPATSVASHPDSVGAKSTLAYSLELAALPQILRLVTR